MAEEKEKQLWASVRYYGDKSKKVYLIDPLLIKDFVSVDTFNFTIPHLITKFVAGNRIEEPGQVFAISDNQKELEEPPKRRIFDNKRRSDVLLEILENQEKPEKNKKSIRAKDDDNMNTDAPKESNPAECSKQTKAQELKAVQKKIKDDARAFAKSVDESIMAQKVETLKRNKLVYSNDLTEIQRKEKEVNDMKMALELQKKEIAEIKAKHEEEKKSFQDRYQKNKELLVKCKQVISTLQNKNENPAQIAQTTDVFAVEKLPAVLQKDTEISLLAERTPFRDRTNLGCTSNLNLEFSTLGMQPETFDKQGSFEVVSEILNDKPEGCGSQKDDETVAQYLPKDGSVDHGYFASEQETNDHVKTDKSKNERKQSRKYKRVKSRQQEGTSDEEIIESINWQQEKRKMAQKTNLQKEENEESSDSDHDFRKSKKAKRIAQRKREGLEEKANIESNETDDDERESFDDTRTKKPKRSNYVPTKKYGDLHSSSQSETDSSDEKKKRFSRDSDDEYLSDELTKSDMPNYKSYKEETGKNRRMYHLKHNISIKRDIWEDLQKVFDVKEWLRILIHAIFKEEELIDKVFNINSIKQNRLSGRKRIEFTRDEKSAIRSTFFCRVDQIVPRRKSANAHKHNWKSYISEHINYLIKREKEHRKKLEKKKKRKAEIAARRISSSASSPDDSEAVE